MMITYTLEFPVFSVQVETFIGDRFTQCSPVGYKVAKFLQDICHREDPTRPVTCGMDQVSCVLANGFAAMIDIPGLNYRTQRYKESSVSAFLFHTLR